MQALVTRALEMVSPLLDLLADLELLYLARRHLAPQHLLRLHLMQALQPQALALP